MIDTLLMFSGGIDSTYVAYSYLLQNPGKKLLIHHINLQNHENRSFCEKRSVDKILNYFQQHNLNNYKYSESSFDYGSMGFIIFDIEIVAFLIYVLLRDPQYKSINNILLPFYMNQTQNRYEWFNNIVNLSNKPLNFYYPIKGMTKKEVMEGLPKDLLELTWYCRTPKNNNVCGNCITCKEIREALL